MFDELIGDSEIDIDCPNCEKEFQIKLGQVGTTVTCPHCGCQIKLENTGDSLAGIEEALDELEDTLNSL